MDYLFRSVANRFPGRSMAVILTGMGSDGTLGLRLLKRHGCFVIAQDEASCVVYGMPKAAVDAGVADAVLPLNSIAGRITAIVRGRPGLTTAITREEMPVWSRYIHEICGIHLDDSKGYLVETRLGGLLPEAGASNFSELFYQGPGRRDQQTPPKDH